MSKDEELGKIIHYVIRIKNSKKYEEQCLLEGELLEYVKLLMTSEYNKGYSKRGFHDQDKTLRSSQMIDISDGDNTYRIPGVLKNKFNQDVDKKPKDEDSDEFYDYCDLFDKEWGEYKI